MTEQNEPDLVETGNTSQSEDKDGDVEDNRESEPAHHARRPMNAFLIFCKRHRSVVREKYPNLENRSITKILGEWWANLEEDEKASYTGLAKKYKDAFFNANPDFKWYKLPAPPLRTLSTRPTNIFTSATPEFTSSNIKGEIDGDEEKTNNNSTKIDYNKRMSLVSQDDSCSSMMFTPGKLADEAQMGGLSSLMTSFDNRNVSPETQRNIFLESAAQITLPCTPKYQNLLPGNDTPGRPRKRTTDEFNPESSNKYFKEESIPSQFKAKAPQSEQSIKELQNALSETSRILEKAFEIEDKSNKSNHKLSNISFNKNGDRLSRETVDQMSDDLTQQEIIDRVVSKKLTDDYKDEVEPSNNSGEFRRLSWDIDYTKDSKASERSCKGKRYQEFMAFGGLYVNKRQKRDYDSKSSLQYYDKNVRTDDESSPSCSWKSMDIHEKSLEPSARGYDSEQDDLHDADKADEIRSAHEGDSCESNSKMFKASDFDLDAKIRALPSLSFDKFHQKKKENKKRKSNLCMKSKDNSSPRYHDRPYMDTYLSSKFSSSQGDIFCSDNKVYIPQSASFSAHFQNNNVSTNNSHDRANALRRVEMEQAKSAITGSKKRKPRKVSITRLDVNNSNKTDIFNREQRFGMVQTEYTTSISTNIIQPPPVISEPEIDLCALETLAEVAANTSKIDENN